MSTTGNNGNHCWIWWWRRGWSGSSDSTNGRSEKIEWDSLSDPGHHLLIGVTSFGGNHGCQFFEKKWMLLVPCPLWLKGMEG